MAGADLEHIEMLKNIEYYFPFKNLRDHSKLRAVHDSISRFGRVELPDDSRLIVRDGSEILIPEPARSELVKKSMIWNDEIWKDLIKKAGTKKDKTEFGWLYYYIYRLNKQIILNPIFTGDAFKIGLT